MLSAKPNDIRKVLEHPLIHRIDGEELGKFLRFALEEAKIDNYLKNKPIAVVVKGNVDRMSDASKKLANKLYLDIKSKLESQGYKVEFDEGLPNTLPRTDADVWLGFSRGADRLQYAPSNVKTYKIESGSIGKIYSGDIEQQRNANANDPLHFTLTDKDLKEISKMRPAAPSLDNYKTALALEQDA